MVYRGKPSKECFACRASKIKCDALPEGCTNCLRSGRKCPGYRNQIDLMFCDESDDIARKAGSTSKRPQIYYDPDFSGQLLQQIQYEFVDCTDEILGQPLSPYEPLAYRVANFARTPSLDTVDAPFAIRRPLTVSREDLALGLFFTHYVVQDNGCSKHLPAPDISSKALFASMKAIGLAGLSNLEKDSRLRKNAREAYTGAIMFTNIALRQTKAASEDSVLLTVVLLSVFESMCSESLTSLDDWTNHINGAASLLALRNPSEIRNPYTIRLILQATAHIMVLCLQKGLSLPPIVLSQQAKIEKLLPDVKSPVWLYQKYIARLTNFRAAVIQRRVTDPESILQGCNELDKDFSSLCPDNTAPGWSFQIVKTNMYPDLIYSGKYHIYENEMCYQTWNGIRCMRILIHETILDVLCRANIGAHFEKVFISTQRAHSTSILIQMQDDILSGVPQSLGYIPKFEQVKSPGLPSGMRNMGPRETFPWMNFGNNKYNLSNQPPSTALPWVRAWGGYTIPWPLYTAGSLHCASDASREYSIKALRQYGQQTGTRQAVLFANALEERRLMR